MIHINDSEGDILYTTLIDFYEITDEIFYLYEEVEALFFNNENAHSIAEKNNYQGKYIFTFKYTENEISKYTFVKVDAIPNIVEGLTLALLPIKLEDKKIFDYIFDYGFDFEDESNIQVDVEYIPYTDILNRIQQDEFIGFDGTIKKRDDICFVQYNPEYGVYFQVIGEPEEHTDYVKKVVPICDLEENDFENMVNDNFMGKIKQWYVNSIGMNNYILHNIIEVTDEEIIFETCEEPTPSISNLVELTEDESDFRLMRCWAATNFEYVPYSEVQDDVGL